MFNSALACRRFSETPYRPIRLPAGAHQRKASTPNMTPPNDLMEISGRIVVYSITGCPHCLRAKNKLSELGLPYNDVNLESFPQVRETVKKLTGGKTTVPQIFFNEVYIGGNEEFQRAVKDKSKREELIKLVTENKAPKGSPEIPDPKTAVDYGRNDEFVCEPDEYAKLSSDIKRSGIIKDHRVGVLKTHKNSFKGQDLIDWLKKNKNLDESRAREMAEELVSRNFGHAVKKTDEGFHPDNYYRLLEDDETRALNAGIVSECKPIAAADLSEQLRRLILKSYSAGISQDGKGVNYKAISKDEDFLRYVEMTKELQRVEVESLTREEKLAFFINIYNALIIHATVKMGPPANLWQRYKFFNTVSYIIGGNVYSLQDIENGVLRGNRKGIGMFRKPFGPNDPRLKIALETCEPLIHFALNCGAKSCPPIKTFSAKGVEAELKVAAEAFFESDDAITALLSVKEIYLSQIFKWYQEDFGGSKQKTIQWILERMADSEKKEKLAKIIKAGAYNISYLHYDWGNNGKED